MNPDSVNLMFFQMLNNILYCHRPLRFTFFALRFLVVVLVGSQPCVLNAENTKPQLFLREIGFDNEGVLKSVSMRFHLPKESPSGPLVLILTRHGGVHCCGGPAAPASKKENGFWDWEIKIDMDYYGPAIGLSRVSQRKWRLLCASADGATLRLGQYLVPVIDYGDVLVCVTLANPTAEASAFDKDPYVRKWLDDAPRMPDDGSSAKKHADSQGSKTKEDDPMLIHPATREPSEGTGSCKQERIPTE